MDLIANLLSTDIGIMATITILGVCVIATCMFFFVKKQVDNDKNTD